MLAHRLSQHLVPECSLASVFLSVLVELGTSGWDLPQEAPYPDVVARLAEQSLSVGRMADIIVRSR